LFFKILLNYILGYLTIEIEGYFIERFINICNNQKIFLWNLSKINSSIMKLNIGIKDFRKIKQIAKKTKCRIKIKKKNGIPFFLNRYKKRKIFLIFFSLIIISIIVLSNFIWNIEIIGNENIKVEEIEELLQRNGFGIGKTKIGLNTKEIINQIRLERDDIAWMGIETNGTNAVVEIVEADLKPEIIKEDEYCNIVATKDGIIVKVSAQNGTPVVKEGDLVTKGSVLIQGWLEGKYTGIRYVNANGQVQAKVWYSQTVKVPFKQTKKVKTGEEESKYSVKINNFQINLSKKLSKFEKYDTIEKNKKLRLFSDFYLPIEINKVTYQEYKNQEFTYTLEDAKKIAIQEAKKSLENQIKDKKISDEKINVKQSKTDVEVEVIYEVLENIGTKEKIVF